MNKTIFFRVLSFSYPSHPASTEAPLNNKNPSTLALGPNPEASALIFVLSTVRYYIVAESTSGNCSGFSTEQHQKTRRYSWWSKLSGIPCSVDSWDKVSNNTIQYAWAWLNSPRREFCLLSLQSQHLMA